MEKGLGFSNFLTQLDGVGIAVLVLLLRSLGGKLVSHTHQGHYQLSGGTARRCFSQTFLEREFVAGSEFDIEGRLRR